jgi:hypothetical protein
MNINRFAKSAALVSASTLILAACDTTSDDDDDMMDDTGSAMVRVLHASPDAPAVNVYLNDAMTPTIEDLDYAASSGFATVDEATYNVDVYGITASGADTASAVITADLDLEEDTRYTVVAVDTIADGDSDSAADITAKVFADTGSLSDDTMVRVQVAHLASDVPQVYVHVTAPTADLSENTALGSISYTTGSDLLGPVEVASGDYRIRVSTDAAGATVAFDSGTVSLAAGSDLFIGAIPNATGIGASPVSLSVLSGTGASSLFDTTVNTAVRAVHAVSDVNAVDIGAAADTTAGHDVAAYTLYENADFKAVADYTELSAATYDVGVDADNNDTSEITLNGAALAAGSSYSILAVGTAAMEMGTDIPLELVAYEDDRRPIATAAKVRIIHASTAAGDVDLYATAAAVDYASDTPAFEDVPFKASTGYFELDAGTYFFTAALAGTETTGLEKSVTLEAGDIYTIIARDLDSDMTESGDPVVEAIIINETE